MTNEELKKKICKIIADNYLPKEMPDRLEDYKLYRFERAADALIAAGIGDIEATTLRAEVAESELERYTALIKPLEAENAALRNEADTNAALSIKNKMRADALEKENAALRSAVKYLIDDGGADCCAKCIYCPHPTEEDDDCLCHHNGDCVDGIITYFLQNDG